MAAIKLICNACNGTGKRHLTRIYQETYDLVKRNPGLRSRDYAALANVVNENMCNRLRQLANKGLLKSEGYLMERTWSVK
jgi:hypothetical protein